MKFADRKVFCGWPGIVKMLADSNNDGVDESMGPDWKEMLVNDEAEVLGVWGLDKVELPTFPGLFHWELYRGEWGDGLSPDWNAVGISEATADSLGRGFHMLKQEFPSASDYAWAAKSFHREAPVINDKTASEYMVIVGSTPYAGYDTLCFWILEKVEVV